MLLLCFKSQENTLHAILFDESGFTELAFTIRLLASWLSTGYLSAFQTVLHVSEAGNLISENK